MADHNPPFAGSSATEGASAVPPARSKSPLRWILSLTLFFLIIGGIAWLVQNMPTWRTSRPAVSAAPKGQENLIMCLHPFDPDARAFVSLWEIPQKPEKDQAPRLYAREFERGANGRYYFPFLVHSEQGCELGVSYISCDCAEVHLAVVTPAEGDEVGKSLIRDPGKEPVENPAWKWQQLKKSDTEGVVLEPGSRVLL